MRTSRHRFTRQRTEHAIVAVLNGLSTPRTLWQLTAAAVASYNMLMAWQTQTTTFALMTVLIWGGALICMEDQLPTLTPCPSRLGLALGLLLTGAGLWRSERVFHLEAVIYALPLLQGLGLALLCVPMRQLGRLMAPLSVLALALLMLVQQRLLPEDTLSRITAQLTHMILMLGGQDARLVAGNEVWLPGGGVGVAGPCSGSETIEQMVVIAAIFVLAFPLRQGWLRALVLAASVLFAVAGNTLRITLLALINASDWATKKDWFDFFHEENGALVFSALTVSAFAWAYLKLLDRQLKAVEARHA
jgi:cyanoexosortase A